MFVSIVVCMRVWVCVCARTILLFSAVAVMPSTFWLGDGEKPLIKNKQQQQQEVRNEWATCE